MKKNAMKNFIFSFLLSLLAVITVNKIVFHAPETAKTDKKVNNIEAKTISLFSKNSQTKEKEVKPIVFADIEKLTATKENIVEKTQNKPIVSDIVETVKVAENIAPKIVYTPEFENNTSNTNVASAPIYNTDITLATELVLEKEAEPVQENIIINENKIAFADISDTLIDEEKLKEAEIFYKPEGVSDTQENIIQTAQNTIPTIVEIEEDIPLIQNDEALHDNINILTSAENSQIAMLEPNSLVSTIETLDEPAEDMSVAEINLKQEDTILATENTPTPAPEESAPAWRQMSETSNIKDQPDDNPWVIAKGNRFAKNKIAQFDALEEDKKEQEKNVTKETPEEIIEISTQEITTEVDTEIDTEQHVKENNIIVHQKTSEIEIQENIEFEVPNSADSNIVLTETISNPSISENIEQLTNTEVSEEHPTEQQAQIFSDPAIGQTSLLEPKPLLIPSSEGTKLARQMMQNLIIPIPESIMNDADTTPILSSTPNKSPKNNKEISEEDKDSGLFKNITSWLSGKKKEKEEPKLEENVDKKKEKKKKISFSLFDNESKSDKSKEKIKKSNNAPTQIMPAELKLAFQPNRAEISGHTLRWIHAFADNARDNPEIYIEIRIDGTSSFSLQQKRLNLLSTIFANRGVDFRKVNIVFTSREPNSFIIRNIRFNNSEEIIINQDENNTHYQQW